MRFLSLFSGIDAASVAWLPLGWVCAGFSEIEKFPSAVLAHHYKGVPNLGDITKITREQIAALGHIDLVVFGFPCQDLSVAGKRAGLHHQETGERTRSGLFFDAMRIVRWSGARWAVAENVPGLFSSEQGRDFALVAGEMVGLELDVPRDGWRNAGVVAGPDGLCEWAVLDAQFFGVPQRRRRVFLVRDTGDWASREPVLSFADSLSGHPAPRREKGKVAPTIPSRSTGGGGLGSDFDCDGGLTICMSTGQGSAEIGIGIGTTLHCGHEAPILAHSLRGEGFDASEDGTGRGTPLAVCALTSKPYADNESQESKLIPIFCEGVAPTLRSGSTNPAAHGKQNGTDRETLIAFSSKDHGADAGEISPTLRSMGHTSAQQQPMREALYAMEARQTARVNGGAGVMAVRRLTPC